MTQTYSWNFQKELGAENKTFSGRSVIAAIERIQRYWDVNFPQVASSPWFRFVLTRRSLGPTIPAWVSGRTCFISASFSFYSFAQSTFVLVHELGHIFGSGAHMGSPGHVMSPAISTPFLNFSEMDAKWYPFSWRSNLRPWQEPRRWYPAPSEMPVFAQHEEIQCAHRSRWADWMHRFFNSTSVCFLN